MKLHTCLRPVDVVLMAAAFATAFALWTTGHQSWIGATSAIPIPLYLAAGRRARRPR